MMFANLIYECISTPSFSVLIDGSPFGFIKSLRGLKQGDPLFPYLFSTATKFLTINLDVELMKGNINPIYKVEPMITHLLYADDILIMAKATTKNAECILNVFRDLKLAAGLNLNENKSTLFFRKGAKNK